MSEADCEVLRSVPSGHHWHLKRDEGTLGEVIAAQAPSVEGDSRLSYAERVLEEQARWCEVLAFYVAGDGSPSVAQLLLNCLSERADAAIALAVKLRQAEAK
ncbi:MAG: hypothetical protein R3B72_01395 [Polyangiaceae bacterium]